MYPLGSCYTLLYLSHVRVEGSSSELQDQTPKTELHSEIKRTQSLLDKAVKEEEAAKIRSRRLEASMIRRKQVYEKYAHVQM